jgi:branched-chain amino acid transport system ATP-binding protein
MLPAVRSAEVPGPLLAVENLSLTYGAVRALSGITFSVKPGEVVALLGSNGAGKSSTARAISGLCHFAGRVLLDGEDISGLPPYEIRRRGICYLPEARGVFPGLSIHDNLRMAARLLPRSKRKAAIGKAMEIYPILRERARQPAANLSGGEQQMLGLARVVVSPARLIVADELSLGLAPLMVNSVFDSLAVFRDEGVSILLIEQFVHRSLDFADTCVLLHGGTIGWQGPAKAAHKEVLQRYLGESAEALA